MGACDGDWDWDWFAVVASPLSTVSGPFVEGGATDDDHSQPIVLGEVLAELQELAGADENTVYGNPQSTVPQLAILSI